MSVIVSNSAKRVLIAYLMCLSQASFAEEYDPMRRFSVYLEVAAGAGRISKADLQRFNRPEFVSDYKFYNLYRLMNTSDPVQRDIEIGQLRKDNRARSQTSNVNATILSRPYFGFQLGIGLHSVHLRLWNIIPRYLSTYYLVALADQRNERLFTTDPLLALLESRLINRRYTRQEDLWGVKVHFVWTPLGGPIAPLVRFAYSGVDTIGGSTTGEASVGLRLATGTSKMILIEAYQALQYFAPIVRNSLYMRDSGLRIGITVGVGPDRDIQ